MESILSSLAKYATALSIVGAAVAFVWSVVQWVLARRREEQHREFEIYHRLIKELVSPDPDRSNVVWIDRQTAVLFELRRFRRYYEHALRTLHGLRDKWTTDPDFKYPRLIEELDLTVDYIRKRA